MDDAEFSFISMPSGYAGLYRVSDAVPFEVLLGGDGRPRIFDTSMQAVRAAKAHLMPPPVARSESVAKDILGVKQWLMGKASQSAESTAIKRSGSFKPFVVERKRKVKTSAQQ